jgi:hypothetical protein
MPLRAVVIHVCVPVRLLCGVLHLFATVSVWDLRLVQCRNEIIVDRALRFLPVGATFVERLPLIGSRSGQGCASTLKMMR